MLSCRRGGDSRTRPRRADGHRADAEVASNIVRRLARFGPDPGGGSPHLARDVAPRPAALRPPDDRLTALRHLARRIAAGDWLGGDRAFYMDPLYPYVLAVTYSIFGHDFLVVRLIQAALGVGTCGLVALVGRRLGGRVVGVLAAILIALYQPLVFEESEIEKTALGVFLLTACLAFGSATSIALRFAAGASLALATLARGNLLLLAPLGAVFFLLDKDSASNQGLEAGRFGRWRERWGGRPGKSALGFIAGFLLALAPVLWRNHHVSGQWILTTSQLGQNFYTGKQPLERDWGVRACPLCQIPARARGGRLPVEGRGHRWPTADSSRSLVILASAGTRPHCRAPSVRGNCLIEEGRSDTCRPGSAGWLVALHFIRGYSPSLRLAFLSMAWRPPLAVVGAAVTIRANRVARLLVGYVAAYAASVVAFFVFPATALISLRRSRSWRQRAHGGLSELFGGEGGVWLRRRPRPVHYSWQDHS